MFKGRMIDGTREKVNSVEGTSLSVQSSRFKVQSSRFKVQGSKFKVQSSRFKVQGSRFPRRFAMAGFLSWPGFFDIPCFSVFG
jgi:hypothetical protein